MLAISLNKTTLKYLYIKWIIINNLLFNLVSNKSFYNPLKYLNSVKNSMLSDVRSTIQIHAQALFIKRKQCLYHVLDTFILDIYITCDMWTLLNYLKILTVNSHFIIKKPKLSTCLLGLIEIQGAHSSLNQSQAAITVLDAYDIINKLEYFVINNVRSNNTLIQCVVNYLIESAFFII